MAAGMNVEETSGMTQFVGRLKNPNPGVITPNPMTPSGGMAESAQLDQAVNTVCTESSEFLKKADGGFTTLKEIVSLCHSEYLNNDEAGAQRIAATQYQTPTETQFAELVAQGDQALKGLR